jgi:acyl-CoA thioesterase
MSVEKLLEPITGQSGPLTLNAASDWMQGRTLYGGASALIAYTMARQAFPDLPPLRAAQIGFVAPISQEMELSATIERQGRNVTQLRSEIHCNGKLALTAFWLFGTARDANAIHHPEKPSDWPGDPKNWDEVNLDRSPSFLSRNFEMRRAQNDRGPGAPIVRRWFRLKDHDSLDPMSALILQGDTLPPGAMRAMQRQGPISSINWSFNVLDPNATTRNGWWLGETRSEHADLGYSSERLSMWNTDGKKVVSGLQSVAIFG